MKSVIVLLGHRARQGKDFLAKKMVNFIKKKYGYRAEIIHWADALKEEVRYDEKNPLIISHNSEYFLLREGDKGDYFGVKKNNMPKLLKIMEGLDREIYYGMKDGEKNRDILQWWGTDYRRKQNDSYWVDRGNEKIKKIISASNVPVVIFIPDTRFPNEIRYVYKNNNIRVIYIDIVRRNNDGTLYIEEGTDPNHPSETSLDHFDFSNDLFGNYYTISAISGDTKKLINEGKKILKSVLNDESQHA